MLWLVMAALVGFLLYACVGTWRLYTGRDRARPLIEYAAMALISGLVGWQALAWLSTDHPDTNQIRHVGVWVQLVSTFGITALMLASGWIARARTYSK